MAMTQAAFLCVSAWMGEVSNEAGLFMHIVRWQLFNVAYEQLSWSTVAWSPSRGAMVKIAMRLLVSAGQRGMDHQFELAARVNRQNRRALAVLPFLNNADAVVTQVRGLVRSYQVMLSVVAGLLRAHPRLIDEVTMLRAAAEDRVVEDGSSSSEEEL